MRRFLKISLAVLVVLGIAWLVYFVVVPPPVPVETAIVRVGTFHEVITSDGVLRSKKIYTVSAIGDGNVRRVTLKAGDPIKKGQQITELFRDEGYKPVRSPITGVISQVHRESAGAIRRGEPIVDIIDPQDLELAVELLTTDAARVRPGNRVRIEGWGGEVPLEATVSRVSQAGFKKKSALGVEEERTEVTATPGNIPKEIETRLGSTFHVDVSIEVLTRKDALIIPLGALFRDGPDWAVFHVADNRARKQKIEIGARGNEDAMIKSGLKAGDVVVNYPGDLVKDGARVKGR